MDDIASLIIRIQSSEAEVADRRLGKLSKSGARAERATDSLTRSMLRLTGRISVVAGVVAGLKKVVAVTREFDVLNAQLITATGSSENAAKAFATIQDFAAQTPHDLQQVTGAFNQLVNLGLTPSEKALTSYGNTALAMGKNLSQVVEAVADATTGEFERLETFGIKAKKQGEDLTFTFRGVKTTVKNEAEQIENYLIALGENEFAGAMANRMNTLDGAMSTLGAEWDELWLNISQQGVGDLIAKKFRTGTDALEELNDMLASGELQSYMSNIVERFGFIGDAGGDALDFVTSLFKTESGEWESYATEAVDYIIDAFKYLPENLKLTMQYVGIEIATIVVYARTYGEAFVDVFGNEISQIGEVVAANLEGAFKIATKGYAQANAETDAELAKIEAKYSGFNESTFAKAKARADAMSAIRRQSLTDAVNEHQGSIGALELHITATKNLRAEYDKQKASDRLAEFKINPDKKIPDGPSSEDIKRSKKVAKEAERRKAIQERELENLVAALRSEKEAIEHTYKQRNEIIVRSTKEGSDFQRDLLKRNEADYKESLHQLGEADRKSAARKQEKLEKEREREKKKRQKEAERLQEEKKQELSKVVESLRSEEGAIHASYKRRLAIILENTEEGSAKQKELKERLEESLREDLEVEDLDRQFRYEVELEEIEEFYTRRKELILENVNLTEELRTELEQKLTKARNKKIEALERQRSNMILSSGEEIFGGLASISKGFAGEQSGIYKAMFAVSKAFAIADSIMKIQQGIAAAAATPWPANLGAIASTVSATAGIISTIQSTKFSGAYDTGGFIPAGKTGIVGEYGMELVQGPASVTSRKTTADIMNNMEKASSDGVVVNIENYGTNAEFEVEQLTEGQVRIIASRVGASEFGKNAKSEFSNANSKGSQAITDNWKVGRAL